MFFVASNNEAVVGFDENPRRPFPDFVPMELRNPKSKSRALGILMHTVVLKIETALYQRETDSIFNVQYCYFYERRDGRKR
jgi:hypothetical protein